MNLTGLWAGKGLKDLEDSYGEAVSSLRLLARYFFLYSKAETLSDQRNCSTLNCKRAVKS